MRPRTFYLSVVLPFAWLAGAAEILRLFVGRIPGGRALTVLEETLVDASLFAVRAMPFAVVAGGLAAPLLTLIAAHFVRGIEDGRPWVKEALTWTGVFFASLTLLAFLLAFERVISLSVPLCWSFSAAYALVVAVSYQAQLALVARGRSRLPGAVLLWFGTIFFFWGLLVVIIPFLAGRGAREARGVVEQGDAPDKARS